jgi:hypothetical protein
MLNSSRSLLHTILQPLCLFFIAHTSLFFLSFSISSDIQSRARAARRTLEKPQHRPNQLPSLPGIQPNLSTPLYRWPNGRDPMGQRGQGSKSTARARHHSASADTRHDLDSAWAAGPAHGTSTGTTRLMSRHDGGTIIPINLIFLAAHDAVAGTRASHPPSR